MSQTDDVRRAALRNFLIFAGGLSLGAVAVFGVMRSNETKPEPTTLPEQPKAQIAPIPMPTTPAPQLVPAIPNQPLLPTPGGTSQAPASTVTGNQANAIAPNPTPGTPSPPTPLPSRERGERQINRGVTISPQTPQRVTQRRRESPARVFPSVRTQTNFIAPNATRRVGVNPSQRVRRTQAARSRARIVAPVPSTTAAIPQPTFVPLELNLPRQTQWDSTQTAPIPTIPPIERSPSIAVQTDGQNRASAPYQLPIETSNQSATALPNQATPSNVQPLPNPSPPSTPDSTIVQSDLPPAAESLTTLRENLAPTASNQPAAQQSSTGLSPLQLNFQGAYLQQREPSVRARITASYPATAHLLVGATVDVTEGTAFADSRSEGLNINELYLVTSLPNLPNLRFAVGQLDLTSYFDRNSFAKDATTHFFNSVFQTNPALSTVAIGSRPAILANWSATDNIEVKAAVFSSARSLGEFSLDAFAGEVGFRYGNAIIRGTYATARDAGQQDGFGEVFQIERTSGRRGILSDDREEGYGVNAEVFIPELKMGVFGRYGWYQNRDLNLGGETYSFGLNFLDVFREYDRIGIAYGRGLSNNSLRDRSGVDRPDVFEVFYDLRLLPYLRAGFTVQQVDEFSETILGFRIKTEFNVSPIERR
jgi:hypothetical protein